MSQRLVTALHVFLYRLLGGRVVGKVGRAPILLLTATGRRSGKRRTTPLLYQRDGDDFVLIASNGGSATHPAWLLNLRSDPRALVELGRARLEVSARTASLEEKSRLWGLMTAVYPTYDEYQRRTARVIDVVVLSPRAAG